MQWVPLRAGEGRSGPDDPLAGAGVGGLGDGSVVEQRVPVVHPVTGGAVVVDAVDGCLLTEVDLDGPGTEVEQRAEPPLVHLDGGRVGEVDAPDPSALPAGRVAEPDVVEAAVLAAYEAVDRRQLVEQRRALGDVGQLPQRHLHPDRRHGVEVAGGVGEPVGVELEVAEPVPAEPVGVEVQHVEGQVLGPHPLGDLERLGGRRVGDLRLPEPERPVRRHVRPTGQVGVGPEHLADVADEHEGVERVVVHRHLELGRGATADPGGEAGVVVGEHAPPRGGDPERHVLVGPRGDGAVAPLPCSRRSSGRPCRVDRTAPRTRRRTRPPRIENTSVASR